MKRKIVKRDSVECQLGRDRFEETLAESEIENTFNICMCNLTVDRMNITGSR